MSLKQVAQSMRRDRIARTIAEDIVSFGMNPSADHIVLRYTGDYRGGVALTSDQLKERITATLSDLGLPAVTEKHIIKTLKKESKAKANFDTHTLLQPKDCKCGGMFHCVICDGGLAYCTVCKGGEIELEEQSCEERLNAQLWAETMTRYPNMTLTQLSDPKYVTPTDDDVVKQRKVWVRDSDDQKWRKARLVAVDDRLVPYRYFVARKTKSGEWRFGVWKQCRMKRKAAGDVR